MIIEASTISIILLFLFFLFIIFHRKFTLKKLQNNYDENDDLGKKGEDQRNILRGLPKTTSPVSGTSKTDASYARLSEPEGRSVLPSTEVIDDGKTSDSDGEPNKSLGRTKKVRRGIFGKLRRKRT